MIERAKAAYAAGLRSLSIGDHHAMRVPYAQNTPMLGRLLAEWPDRPAGCLFLVPLWHPVIMAEQIGTLTAMHDAPFIVQTGIGYGEDQFEAMSADHSTRGATIEATVPLVQAMLRGEVVDSKRFDIVGGRVGLLGDQPIEWWMGGTADVALERAARLGACWYAGPGTDVEGGRKMIDTFKSAGGNRAVVRKDMLVLSDGDEARATAQAIVDAGYRGMGMGQLLVGNPDDVAESIAELEAVGFDQVVVRAMNVTQAQAIESIELVGSLT